MRRFSTIIGFILAMLAVVASICHADSAISYPLVESPDGTEHILAIQDPTSDEWRIIRIPSSEFEGEGGSQDYTDIIAALNEQGIYPGEIVFTTTGSTFSPTIVLNGVATVEWTFSDGTTSDSTTPTVDLGSAATRQQRLKVTPWANLYRINIGYAGADGGASTDELGNTFEQVASQAVTAITNLDLIQDSLVYLAACGCPITSLDVRNFTALHTLEFYDCDDLVVADIYGTSNLRRACFEHSPVGFLDFSASPLMEDVRGSYCDLMEIRWGTTGQYLWHMCVRENDGTLDPSTWPDMEQFPVLEDMWISGNGLTGDLSITSTSITSAWLYDNDFSTIDLSGAFPSGTHYVDAYNNPNCTTITIDNCPGLTELDASGCALTQTNIDYILATLDANGASNGEVDLSGGTSSSPSAAGLTSQANLQGKGWTVTVNGSAAPTLSSATIGSDGTTWTLVFSEAVTIGSGGSSGFSVTMTNAGAITLTYSSGDGTSTLVYTGDVTVQGGDTVSSGLDYTQPGDGIEDADGYDLASFTGASVSNNSTQGGSTSIAFTTELASVEMYIETTGDPTVLWSWSDDTTDSSNNPTKDFGSAATRTHTLTVTPATGLLRFGVPSNFSTDHGVSSVSGLSNYPDLYYVIFYSATSGNSLTDISLSGCSGLLQVHLAHTSADSDEVDQWFIDLAAATGDVSGEDADFYFPANTRTSASDTAYNTLVANGWVMHAIN